MTLGQKQRKFMKCVGQLLAYIYFGPHNKRYAVTLGDGYRDPRVFGKVGLKKGYGRSSSNHKIRLAIDLNLFIDEKYQTTTEAHKPLGEFWESLDPDCAWGGHFNDGNHYSFSHLGRR